ncbi:MAG: hypothetical protein HYY93_15405 [Planctomycetes bacterium]|nr:hypothetical protein [Planctomycetota bacterium]
MQASLIRKVLNRRPFVPLEFVLDSGEKVRLGSPEVLIGRNLIVMFDRDEHPLWFTARSVNLIRVAGKNGRPLARAG